MVLIYGLIPCKVFKYSEIILFIMNVYISELY